MISMVTEPTLRRSMALPPPAPRPIPSGRLSSQLCSLCLHGGDGREGAAPTTVDHVSAGHAVYSDSVFHRWHHRHRLPGCHKETWWVTFNQSPFVLGEWAVQCTRWRGGKRLLGALECPRHGSPKRKCSHVTLTLFAMLHSSFCMLIS